MLSRRDRPEFLDVVFQEIGDGNRVINYLDTGEDVEPMMINQTADE